MNGIQTIGLMRHTATFQTNTPGDLGAGQVDSTTNLLTTRGYLEDLSGHRTNDAGAIIITKRWRFTCRYSAGLETGIKSTTRIVIINRYFTIDTFKKVGQRDFYYEFMLNETER